MDFPTPYLRYLAVTFSPVVRSLDLEVHGSSYLGQYAQVNTLAVNNISSIDYLRLKGVAYLSGTMVNPNVGTPLTAGDDLRVDGEIWRGPSKGTSDGMPLKISDTVIPTLDNINDLGSASNRWRNAHFSGNIEGNHLTLAGNIAAKTSNLDTL